MYLHILPVTEQCNKKFGQQSPGAPNKHTYACIHAYTSQMKQTPTDTASNKVN